MKYGLSFVANDCEMSGNMSDCSDDSFEIVSAESVEEQESVISSTYKPSVLFQEMFDVYPVDTDIVARVSFVDGYEKSPEDKVIIVPVAWESLEQGLYAVELKGNYVKFDVKDLPKTSADKFYQLCYSSKEKIIMGVSAPFSFREVHEDELMEFQKEQNKEFWTFRSRFAVLMNTYWNSLIENKKIISTEKTVASISENIKSINLEDAATSTEPTDAERDTVIARERQKLQSEYEDQQRKLQQEFEEKLNKFKEELTNAEIVRIENNNQKIQKIMDEHKVKEKEQEEKIQKLQSHVEESEKLLYEQNVKETRQQLQIQELEKLKAENAKLTNDLEKIKEAHQQVQVQELEKLKAENAKLTNDLEKTKDFVEYMVTQKDERLRHMMPEKREAHVHVYETMKSSYRLRNPDRRFRTRGCQTGLNIRNANVNQPSTSGEPTSTAQTIKDKSENIPDSVELQQLELGYENEKHRKDHLTLLKRLKAWFECEALDGFEDMRNDLRTQYYHMERINQHLTKGLHDITKQYNDLKVTHDQLRKDLVHMECKLASKTTEKVMLLQELENLRAQGAGYRSNGCNSKIPEKKKDSIIHELTRDKELISNELDHVQQEIARHQMMHNDQQKLLAEKERKYANQLVSLTFQNQKLKEAYDALKDDFEARLKIGAKEFAKLSLKYQKTVKPSDHTYASLRSHHLTSPKNIHK